MQSFKQFLIEGMKRAKRSGTIPSLEKEAMRQAVRMARKRVDREAAEEEDRELNPDDYLDTVKINPIGQEEMSAQYNIGQILDTPYGNYRSFRINVLDKMKDEEKTDENFERRGREFDARIAEIGKKATAIERQAYAAAWADKIMDRQPVIANKALQDAARRYEIETRTEKKIPLFGGAHKKFIYKHG